MRLLGFPVFESLDFMSATSDNERVKLEELEKIERDFISGIERRRESLNNMLLSLNKDEAMGLEAFRILREQLSKSSDQSILEAMQTGFDRASLMDEMVAIIPTLTGVLDINTIREIIEGRNPTIRLNPTSVSNNLRKLHKKGLIDLVQRGQGNKTSTYKISQKWLDQLHEEEMENAPIVR